MIYITSQDAIVLQRLLELAKYTRPAATLTAMRALPVPPAAGHLAVCDVCADSLMHVYTWNTTSSATDDGLNAIKPASVTGAGRWLLNDTATSTYSRDSDLLDGHDSGYFATSASVRDAGMLADPVVTDHGDGTFSIAYSVASLYPDATFQGVTSEYELASAGPFAPTDGMVSYLVADYASGSPVYSLITDVELITESSVVPVLTIQREGVKLNILGWDSQARGLPNKIHQRLVKTERFSRQYGLELTEGTPGTRYFTVAAGKVWYGATHALLGEIVSTDGAPKEITGHYHVGGAWTSTPISSYNNTYYDDGTDVVALPASRYAVNWVYRSIGSRQRVCVFLGSAAYKLSEAVASQPPAVPASVASMGMLVGRIIVQQGAASATQIDSAFDLAFSPGTSMDHEDLSNRLGYDSGTGAAWHLTPTEHTEVTAGDLVHAPALLTDAYIIVADGGVRGVRAAVPFASIPVNAIAASAVSIALTSSHDVMEMTTAGTTATLPNATSFVARRWTVANSSTGNVTVDTTGGQTINGLTSQTVPAGSSMTVVSNGSNWLII